jgi:hypothetical protein
MSGRITLGTFGFAALSALLPDPAGARTSWASGTYIYASPCAMAEDATERRVTLRRSPLGDSLVYEAATLSAPVRVEAVTVDTATKGVAFAAEADGHPIRFTGTLAVDALAGVLEDESGPHPVHLARVLRPHGDATCRAEAPGAAR